MPTHPTDDLQELDFKEFLLQLNLIVELEEAAHRKTRSSRPPPPPPKALAKRPSSPPVNGISSIKHLDPSLLLPFAEDVEYLSDDAVELIDDGET